MLVEQAAEAFSCGGVRPVTGRCWPICGPNWRHVPGRWLKWSLLAIAGLFFLWQVWLLAWVLLWAGESR